MLQKRRNQKKEESKCNNFEVITEHDGVTLVVALCWVTPRVYPLPLATHPDSHLGIHASSALETRVWGEAVPPRIQGRGHDLGLIQSPSIPPTPVIEPP